MKPLVALYKIDNTICLNCNEDSIKFNIDDKCDPTLYRDGEGYNPEDTDCKDFEDYCECYETIESALKHLEVLEQELCVVKTMEDLTIEAMKDKKLKAFEIIKEKQVNVFMLLWYFVYSGYDKYVNDFEKVDYDTPILSNKLLTQEEYNLLKEALL